MVTSRKVVYTLMQILDPEETDLRKKCREEETVFTEGPNYL